MGVGRGSRVGKGCWLAGPLPPQGEMGLSDAPPAAPLHNRPPGRAARPAGSGRPLGRWQAVAGGGDRLASPEGGGTRSRQTAHYPKLRLAPTPTMSRQARIPTQGQLGKKKQNCGHMKREKKAKKNAGTCNETFAANQANSRRDGRNWERWTVRTEFALTWVRFHARAASRGLGRGAAVVAHRQAQQHSKGLLARPSHRHWGGGEG